MKLAASIFSLVCGILMLIVWVVLAAAGQVAADLAAKPIETPFLLLAEVATAAALLAGGFGVLRRRAWGLRAQLAALGMLLYCAVFSIGVFGQAGNPPAAGFFAVIAVLSLVFAGALVLQAEHA